MKPFVLLLSSLVAIGVASSLRVDVAAQGATGTITGHVKLTGPEPGNPVIRMGMDPMCAKLNAGKRPIHEYVLVDAKGGLANAFVDLQGNFPKAAAPSAPAVLDQRNCIYTPRVIGARAGGTLRIVNDDPVVHNVHSGGALNPFNFSEQKAGVSRDVTLKGPDVMMRVGCDIHSWMLAWVGVETHPYYAVSGADGSFKIANVPAGKHTIRVWHERFGQLTQTVSVTAGGTANVDFSYTGKEKPSKARIQELVVPSAEASLDLRLVAGD
jgi:plastocyanin